MMPTMSLLSQPLQRKSSRWFIRTISCGLGLTVTLSGIAPAHANVMAHLDLDNQTASADIKPMDDVWELIRTADAHADAAEYDAAIVDYTQALKQLSGDPEWASQYNHVRRMLGEAHLGAFRISKKTLHLRKAKESLQTYFDTLEASSKDRPETEALLQQIERELQTIEDSSQKPNDSSDDKPKSSEPSTTLSSESMTNDHLPMSNRSKAMIISGAVLGGLGLVAAGLSGVAIAEWRRLQARGEQGVKDLWTQAELDKIGDRRDQMATLTLIGGLSTGAMILTGAILIGVARSSHKKNRMANIYPVLSPGGFGIGFSNQF